MLKIFGADKRHLHTPRQEKCLGIGAKQNSKRMSLGLLERQQSDRNLSLDYKSIRTTEKFSNGIRTKE
jgi:hypothetical protein